MALLPSFFPSAGFFRQVRDWADCALNVAFPWPESTAAAPVRIEPPWCRQCGFPYPALEGHAEIFTCSRCAARRWHFLWARAGYRTEGEVHEAIVGFKYYDQYYQHARLVEWLAEAFDRHAADEHWDALVPVPLYHRRRRERGFNQARELADGLGKRRKIEVYDALYRYRETPSQVGLTRAGRWDNMTGAFRLKPRFDVKGLNLLLIDDVFTTGATTNACAQALAQAGASRLAVLTIARS
jgi:ComF family protein